MAAATFRYNNVRVTRYLSLANMHCPLSHNDRVRVRHKADAVPLPRADGFGS